MPKKGNHILFLNLYTFSLTGGIEKVCKNFIDVLHDLFGDKGWHSLSLYDCTKDINKGKLKAKTVKGFNNNKLLFFISSLLIGIKTNTIILSHINLLLIAKVISLLKPNNRIILFAHGIEVWGELPKWKVDFLNKKAEIWAVSNFTKQILIDKQGILKNKIVVLNNSLEPNLTLPSDFSKPLSLLKKYQLEKDYPVIYTLTRISSNEKYKGYDNVIKALGKLKKEGKHYHYLIAGKSDTLEKKRLENLIAENDLNDEVKLLGYIDENELNDHFLLSDVFAMPSKGEGFGIVFIEAAAHGCQVIAGDKDGSTDALLNGKLGQLVDPDDVDAIAVAIEHAVANKNHHPKLQQQLTIENFGFETYKNKVAQLLTAN